MLYALHGSTTLLIKLNANSLLMKRGCRPLIYVVVPDWHLLFDSRKKLFYACLVPRKVINCHQLFASFDFKDTKHPQVFTRVQADLDRHPIVPADSCRRSLPISRGARAGKGRSETPLSVLMLPSCFDVLCLTAAIYWWPGLQVNSSIR